MGVLGNSSINENENIGALFSHPVRAILTKKDDKLKHTRSAKFTDAEIEKIDNIKTVIGTDNDSKALRWILEKLWEVHGVEIEKIAKMKKNVGNI